MSVKDAKVLAARIEQERLQREGSSDLARRLEVQRRVTVDVPPRPQPLLGERPDHRR